MAKPFAGRSFLGTFGLVFLAIAVLFVADTFLAKTERAESLVEARRLFIANVPAPKRLLVVGERGGSWTGFAEGASR